MRPRAAAALAIIGMLLAACGSSSPPVETPIDPGSPGVPPMAPYDGVVACGVEPDTLKVGWRHEGFRSGYEIQLRRGDGSWEPGALVVGFGVEAGATITLGAGIPIGTRLGFRIRAQNGDAWSDWSSEISTVRPRAHVSILPDKQETGGTVHIKYLRGWVSRLSPSRPDLFLYAGDQLIAHMGPPPWTSFDWDTFPFLEGEHDFNLRLEDGQRDPTLQTVARIRINRRTYVTWQLQGVQVRDHDLYVSRTPQVFSLLVEPVMRDAPLPASARLWAGEWLIADLGPYPWQPITWDPGTVPEGDHEIRLELPGYSRDPPAGLFGRTSWNTIAAHVDRTPATITCIPPLLGAASGWTSGFLAIVSDEPVTLEHPTVSFDGGATTGMLTGRMTEVFRRWEMELETSAPLPFPVQVAGGATDRAGNLAVLDCGFDAPAWLAPWGDGPILAGTEVVKASSLAFEARLEWQPDPSLRGLMAWTPAADQPLAGRLLAAADPGGGFQAHEVVGTDGAACTSASVSTKRFQNGIVPGTPWVAWTETDAAGPSPVRLARWDGAAWRRDPAGGVGSSTQRPANVVLNMGAMVDGEGVAAYEVDGSGGVPGIAAQRLSGGTWTDPGAIPAVLPGSSQGAPAVATGPWGSATTGLPSMLLAYTETGPGGVPQIRAALSFPGKGWSPAPSVVNLDPSVSATEPTAVIQVAMAVAWVESGKVLVREYDLIFGYPDFTTVSVLNHDPGRRARSPRAVEGGENTRAPITIYFVEEGPGGDEIWARRWSGSSWVLLPGPVNAGVAGPVRSLTVSSMGEGFGASIAWLDDQGRAFVRAENR